MKTSLILLFALAPLVALAQDDFGTWLELSAEKRLPRNFSLGLEGELRLDDNSTRVDRLSLGLGLGYRVNKYLRLGATYNFMGSYTAQKCKPKTNGYNLTESYWTPRHRLALEATGTVKLWRWLRVSLRERYQLTRRAEVTDIAKDRYRFQTVDGQPVLRPGYPEREQETRAARNDQVLRSRLKLSLDKKHLAWSPFLSVEFHNSIDHKFHLHKLRTRVGCEYKINRHHGLSLSYILTNELDESPNRRMHAIGAGYEFKF